MDIPSMTGTDPAPIRRPRAAVLIPILAAAVPVGAMIWSSLPWSGVDAGAVLAAAAFMLFAILPFAVIGLLVVRGRSIGWLWWSMVIYGLVAGLLGFVFCVSILTSESSTAAIGFVFLPFYQLIGIPVALLIGALAAWVAARRR